MSQKIKIGLFGFGRTGRAVALEFLNDPLFALEWVVRRTPVEQEKYVSAVLGQDSQQGKFFSLDKVNDRFFEDHRVDVIVDFSSSRGYLNYLCAAEIGIKVVSAISKYKTSDIENLKMLAEKTAVLYSPNITLGINFLVVASQVLQNIAPHADIEIVEEHFRDKKEASGTALKIADLLNLEKEKHVNSIRVGGVVGKHEVIFGLPSQTIRLVHESINRAAFGNGAKFAAGWLVKQDKGFYSMENIIIDMFKHNIPVY